MSGPKDIDYDYTPPDVDIDVDCDEEERLEIIRALKKAGEHGRDRGVTYMGYNNLRIHVSGYASISVAEVRNIIAQAKKNVAEIKEKRRLELLARAKEAEKERVERALEDIENTATRQLEMIEETIFRCEEKIDRLRKSKTNTKSLETVSAEDIANALNTRVQALNKKKDDIVSEAEQKIAALEQHREQIDGYAKIEWLNAAIARSPSLKFSSLHSIAEQKALLADIEEAQETFLFFADYVIDLEQSLQGRSDVAELMRALNITLANHAFVTVEDIAHSVSLMKDSCQKYAQQQLAGDVKTMFAFIEQFAERFEQMKVSTSSAMKTGTGIELQPLIDDVLLSSQKLLDRSFEFEYMREEKRSERNGLKSKLELLCNAEKNAVTYEDALDCQRTLERIVNEGAFDNAQYLKFKALEIELEKMQRRAEAAEITPSEVGVNWEEIVMFFEPDYAEEQMREMRAICDVLEHKISIVTRDGRATQLIASLVNRANGSAGVYEIFSDEIVADEKRRLRFTKPGSFGVIYEYVVEPGNKMRRDVRGVKLEGRAIISKEALINKKKQDCDDVAFLSKDVESMGSRIRVVELQTPEESSDLEGFVSLNEEEMKAYLEQVLPNMREEQRQEVVARVADGEEFEEIVQTLQLSSEYGREQERYQVADVYQALHIDSRGND